jgi:hypothetical protein
VKLIDTIIDCDQPGVHAPGISLFRFRLFASASRLEIGLLTGLGEESANVPALLGTVARAAYDRLVDLGSISRNTPLLRHWSGSLERGFPPQFAFLLVTRTGDIDYRYVSLPAVIQLLSCGPEELFSSPVDHPLLSQQLSRLLGDVAR